MRENNVHDDHAQQKLSTPHKLGRWGGFKLKRYIRLTKRLSE